MVEFEHDVIRAKAPQMKVTSQVKRRVFEGRSESYHWAGNTGVVRKLEKETEDRARGFLKARKGDFIFVDSGELLMASD